MIILLIFEMSGYYSNQIRINNIILYNTRRYSNNGNDNLIALKNNDILEQTRL